MTRKDIEPFVTVIKAAKTAMATAWDHYMATRTHEAFTAYDQAVLAHVAALNVLRARYGKELRSN